jgi:hydrogenase maturation protein HypF
MIAKRVNTVSTSSCGRLFDAVASLIGLRQEVTFEGQAAIELEMATQPGVHESYPFAIEDGASEQESVAQIDMRPMIAEIVADITKGASKGVMASRFHNTVADAIAEICRRIRWSDGLNRVCLSGGSFQNIYLLDCASTLLEHAGFEVFQHSAVPANDGGIALGQAVIASEILSQRNT